MAGHVCLFVSNSLQPNRLQPTRLPCPWDFPGKNTGAGCHFLLQRIFLTQGSNLRLLFPALAGGFFTTGATLECGDLIPSPMKTEKDPSSKCSMKSESESHSVVSDSLRPHGLYVVQGILQARILEWEAFPFSRGIFPNQRSNSGLLHCRWILYQLSHK